MNHSYCIIIQYESLLYNQNFKEKFRSWPTQSSSAKDCNSLGTKCEVTLLVAFAAMFGGFFYQYRCEWLSLQSRQLLSSYYFSHQIGFGSLKNVYTVLLLPVWFVELFCIFFKVCLTKNKSVLGQKYRKMGHWLYIYVELNEQMFYVVGRRGTYFLNFCQVT